MAYGQTGTGKTYTMEGFTSEEERGIIPRSIEEVFNYIYTNRNSQLKFLVRASYMQIYNEVISDLLEPPSASERGSLAVRNSPTKGVYVDGLSEWVVRTPDDVYGLIQKGTSVRATSATKMSELSSRSHAIFTIVVEVMEGDREHCTSYHFGKLNIVDLAGSEKVRQSGVTGVRLEETKKINKSLHELGNVIAALSAQSLGKPRHIPFRNSILTSVLRDSLGGNCKMTLIACISPALESYTESLSTLMFANRAKNIKNHAKVNEDLDQTMLLRRYEQELASLRQQLREQQLHVFDATNLHEVEEGRRRAEEERMAAMEELSRTSAAREEEFEIRKSLENRIQELQRLIEEGGMDGDPQTSQEYHHKLEQLEVERQSIEEEKAQVDCYKRLLLKQRDIMLSLTRRLNERDETILELQTEIDAYDAHVEMLEEQLLNDKDGAYEIRSEPNENSFLSATISSDLQRVGKPYMRAIGMFSKAQAEEYVRRARVNTPATGGNSPRYRSDLNPTELMTAEEKMTEMLQLRGPHAADGASSAPGSGISQADLQKIEGKLEDRAASIAKQCYASQLEEVMKKYNATLAKSKFTEDKCAFLVKRAALTGGEVSKIEELERMYAKRVEQLLDAINNERKERRQLLHEVSRVRYEVDETLKASGVSSPATKMEVSRLWQKLQEVEEGVLYSLTETPLVSSVQEGAPAVEPKIDHGSAATQSVVEEYQEKIRLLQKASQDAQRQKEEELENVRHRAISLEKDKQAIRTILDVRIKKKIDTICQTLARCNASTAPHAVERIALEANSLLNIVNASIAAIDNDS
ncbi:kinesin [Angomonas deanei]|uniref:Kinesin-like protein n=1 Tax=Angomonas deanei TaxID=59799 RepID=A0A7G2CC56_9TRYP|nr:kinesin [Angomonas deanei]CAD2217396.1 Microtubule binding/Kinesin motor domain containing protein, putative [Angomonas deanei]|eukprot:EPY32494.1 kinesin [Angomonas deanei]